MRLSVLILFALFLAPLRAEGPASPLFHQDFEKVAEGAPPEDLQVLNGEFTVKKVEGNGCLELAPDPLDSDSFFFGPADQTAYTVSGRIQAMASGKRMPEFGLGACGPDRYRLWVMPAVGELQLIRAGDVVKKMPLAWKSGTWVWLKLQTMAGTGGKFVVRGKAWNDGEKEPADWMLTMEDDAAPRPGRAGALATPYSGQVTRFDDLRLEKP